MGAEPVQGVAAPRVVAFGGGHGLAAALAAWLWRELRRQDRTVSGER